MRTLSVLITTLLRLAVAWPHSICAPLDLRRYHTSYLDHRGWSMPELEDVELNGVSVDSFDAGLVAPVPSSSNDDALARHTRSRIAALHRYLPPMDDTERARAWLFNTGGFPLTLADGPSVDVHWRTLLTIARNVIASGGPTTRYAKHRHGFHIPWRKLPWATRQYFLPTALQAIVLSYLKDPLLFISEIHGKTAKQLLLFPRAIPRLQN
jgi:hypothetical protein